MIFASKGALCPNFSSFGTVFTNVDVVPAGKDSMSKGPVGLTFPYGIEIGVFERT